MTKFRATEACDDETTEGMREACYKQLLHRKPPQEQLLHRKPQVERLLQRRPPKLVRRPQGKPKGHPPPWGPFKFERSKVPTLHGIQSGTAGMPVAYPQPVA